MKFRRARDIQGDSRCASLALKVIGLTSGPRRPIRSRQCVPYMPHKYTRATSDELRVRCTVWRWGRLVCESAARHSARVQSIVNRHLVDRYTGALSETRNALTFFAY